MAPSKQESTTYEPSLVCKLLILGCRLLNPGPPEDPRENRGRGGLWKVPPPWEPAAKPARSHGGLEAFGSHTPHSLDGGIAYKPLTRGWVPFTRSGWVLFTLSKRMAQGSRRRTQLGCSFRRLLNHSQAARTPRSLSGIGNQESTTYEASLVCKLLILVAEFLFPTGS